MRKCDKCHTQPFPQVMFKCEDESGKRYWFCRPCTKEAYILLDSRLYKNKNDRNLLKDMGKFLNETAN